MEQENGDFSVNSSEAYVLFYLRDDLKPRAWGGDCDPEPPVPPPDDSSSDDRHRDCKVGTLRRRS